MSEKDQPRVAILMGSDSDWPIVQNAAKTLDEFGIVSEVRVISAHRTPDLAAEYAKTASKRGLKIIISAAGGAAHLGGVLAAHTTLPVIGIPIKGGALNGMDQCRGVTIQNAVHVFFQPGKEAGILDQAMKEAELFSEEASGLVALAAKVRGLSST